MRKRSWLMGIAMLAGLMAIAGLLLLISVHARVQAETLGGILQVDKSPTDLGVSEHGNWQINRVIDFKLFGNLTDRSLAMGGDGNLHIAAGDESLYHAWYDGVQWQVEVVDQGPQAGSYAALALAATPPYTPHISYFDNANADLKYAYLRGDEWVVEVVDDLDDIGPWTFWTSLDIDNDGYVHISYFDFTDPSVKYARQTPDGWTIEPVESTYWGRPASLAVDETGVVHLTYRTDAGIRYGLRTAGGWSLETVADAEGGPSLALDSAGNPHIVYAIEDDDYHTFVVHAQLVAGEWITNSFPSLQGDVFNLALTLDNADNPVITCRYYEDAGCGIEYARWTGSAWDQQFVMHWTEGGTCNDGPAPLVMDGYGNPQIVYIGEVKGNGNLRHAHWTGSEWEIQTAVKGGTSRGDSLSLDSWGVPHLSYTDEGWIEGELNHVAWRGNHWDIQRVTMHADDIRTSLTMDTSEFPHISYYYNKDWFDRGLAYAYWTGTQWVSQTVDSWTYEGIYSATTSLVLEEGTGYPHISYYRDGLGHAFYDGAAWQTETVDSDWNVGWYASLALDGSDHPHISYYDGTNGNLRYARWNGGQWITETVDESGCVGWDTSLALDANNYPHISYYDGANGNLKYAQWDGSHWITEVLDDSGDVGQDTSLVLDVNGHPHISYYDSTNEDLKYVYWDGSQWIVEAVDGSGDVGQDTSLALDEGGYPHIIYYDSTYTALKYAWQVLAITIDATGGTLSAVSGVSIGFPAGAVTDTTAVVYTPVDAVVPPSGFSFAGQAFDLEVNQGEGYLPDFVFEKPVTVTIYYSPADIVGIEEDSLALMYWNHKTSSWEDAACGDYNRYPDEDWLAVPICHLSRFALFWERDNTVYLPLVLRNCLR